MKRILAALLFVVAATAPALALDTPFMYTEGYSTTTKTGTEVISGGISTKKSTSSTADRTFNVDAQTGNVTSSGTVNGRNIAQDGAKLDGVSESTATLRTDFNNEISSRTNADAGLTARLNQVAVDTTTQRTDFNNEISSRANADNEIRWSTWTAVAGYGITKAGSGNITLAVDTDTLHIPAANIYPGMLPLGVTPQALAPGSYNDIHVSTADVALTLDGQGAAAFAMRAEVSASTASLQAQLNDLAVVSSTGAILLNTVDDWNEFNSMVNIDTTTTPGSLLMWHEPGDPGKSYSVWYPYHLSAMFWDMDMNSSGTYQVAARYGGAVMKSEDSGITWSNTSSGTADWRGIAMSIDGSTMTACASTGELRTSTDYGANWTTRDSSRYWYDVAMSTDGKNQIACVNNAGGDIYVSTDYGANWTAKSIAGKWDRVAMSHNGMVMVAVGYEAPSTAAIMVSTDSGVSFQARQTGYWFGVDVSIDGSTMTACGSGIYTSSDYGQTWVERVSGGDYKNVSMSAGGQTQLITTGNNPSQLKLSTNYGITWNSIGWNATLHQMAIISDDATKITSNERNDGYVYTLINSSASYISSIYNAGSYFYQWQEFTATFSTSSECNIRWYMRSGASTTTVSAAAWTQVGNGNSYPTAAGPYLQLKAEFNRYTSGLNPELMSMGLGYENSQFFRKDDGININYLVAAGTPSATTFLRGDAAWSEIEYAALASTANAVNATGTPSASTFLRGDYTWAETGTSAVVISTFAINAIAIGGDVLVSSAAFSNVPGDTYNIEWSTSYVTGLMVKVVTPSTVGSTYFKVAYSSSTGTTRTWEYVSNTIEVSTNSCTSGWYTVNIVLPPGTVIALHTTSIPASGTLPTNWCLVVRYYKEN